MSERARRLQAAVEEVTEFLGLCDGYDDNREVRLMAGTADENAVVSLGSLRVLFDAALRELTGGTS